MEIVLRTGEMPPGKTFPLCDNQGNYKAKQCSREEWVFVTTLISNIIALYHPLCVHPLDKSLPQCLTTLVQRALLSSPRLPGPMSLHHLPNCPYPKISNNKNGSFSLLVSSDCYCYSGNLWCFRCYCVDKDGRMINGYNHNSWETRDEFECSKFSLRYIAITPLWVTRMQNNAHYRCLVMLANFLCNFLCSSQIVRGKMTRFKNLECTVNWFTVIEMATMIRSNALVAYVTVFTSVLERKLDPSPFPSHMQHP